MNGINSASLKVTFEITNTRWVPEFLEVAMKVNMYYFSNHELNIVWALKNSEYKKVNKFYSNHKCDP